MQVELRKEKGKFRIYNIQTDEIAVGTNSRKPIDGGGYAKHSKARIRAEQLRKGD